MAEFGSIDSLVNWTTAEDSAATERMSATVVTSDGDTGEPGLVAPLTAAAGLGQAPYVQEAEDDGEHRPDGGAVEPGIPGDLVEISGDGTPPEPHDPPPTDPTASTDPADPAREDTQATEDDPAPQSPPTLETAPSASTPSEPPAAPETPTTPDRPEETPDRPEETPDRPEETPSSGEPTPDRPAATTPEDTTKVPDVAKPPTATTPKADGTEESPKETAPAGGGGGMPSGGTPTGATPDPTAATPTTPAAAANKNGSGTERPQDPKATALSNGGVSGDWRKASPDAMERLGQSLAPTQAGGTHTPGDRFRAVERTVRGATPGFPGFGLVGKFAFDGAYDAARNSAADYLKHAKKQLGRWQTQLDEGAKVIRAANDKSTPKK
ncbi:hypothetical protein ACFFV7_09550 [Nonomuraea spiralis]|uniref:Uncharacterized protein n=1 Tax=Nonomuraea spiralis TaxID=46182 RepID=A0ABV5ICE4_9ACTN|nr:hypothetical protein [Nonomuraea spiralis]GGT04853.1 hypothetical protein GCM10010176_056480 [Nonomuraea spiralis]